MHELSIAQSLIETAADSARDHGLIQVLRVRAAVGALSGVDPGALVSAWEIAREQPGFEASELVCDLVPVTIYCHLCQRVAELETSWRLVCPVCDTPSRDVRTGRELMLIQLEGE